MAHLELLLRRCLRPYLSRPFPSLRRSLSSKPEPAPTIKPVSYAVKPTDPSQEDDDDSPSPSPAPAPPPPRHEREPRSASGPADAASSSWSRADARFVKDAPAISPVSYPTRVAPLPEDRPAGEEEREERREGDEQLRREARRIEGEARVRSYFGLRQQEEKVPFPTLIRQEKKPQRMAMELQEAIREVKVSAAKVKRKFIESVEAHVNLCVDPRRGDQMVRGALTLPHGTGKTVRVAVFAEGAAAEEARTAGADIVGGDELIEEIKNGGGKLNFDKCISTPMFMPRLSKIARILGPRGLMPNPKLGSVTSDVSGAVREAKSGRIDFKIDKTAIVHVGLGKVNFSEESLCENIGAFVNALLVAKPVGLKKTSKYAGYVKSFTLSSTMGPGFPISIQSLSTAADHYNKLHVK